MDWQADLARWLDEDWVHFLAYGIGAIALSVFAWYRDRSRKLRSNPDAVPWVPWRDVAFWSSFAALMMLGAAFLAWLAS
jgi:hypothetical protein